MEKDLERDERDDEREERVPDSPAGDLPTPEDGPSSHDTAGDQPAGPPPEVDPDKL